MTRRWFEDFTLGETGTTGACEVTEDGIIRFAEQYDPQPFHLDHDAARESLFGGLAASGWHTLSLANRLLVHDWLHDAAVAGAAGFDELRWRRPVYPGDELSCRYTVAAANDTPDERFGELRVNVEVVNQDDTVVMSMEWLPWLARRAHSGPPGS